MLSFPQYDEPSSYFIRQYLSGSFGATDHIGPYTASLFYAIDRYQAAVKIREALAAGTVVISDRFAGSSMARQGAKIPHTEERRGFFIWLDNLEFCMLNTPRPDISLVLRVPAATAAHHVTDRRSLVSNDRKIDKNEADTMHLQSAADVYDDLCQLFPKDFVRIDCMRGKHLMSIEHVNNLLWGKIEPLLPVLPVKRSRVQSDANSSAPMAASPRAVPTEEQLVQIPVFDALQRAAHQPNFVLPITLSPATKGAKYYVPSGLDKKTRALYISHMDRILAAYQVLNDELTQFLQKQTPRLGAFEAREKSQAITQLVLPLATHLAVSADCKTGEGMQIAPSGTSADELQHIADTSLKRQHSDPGEAVSLTNVWPRNELDIVADTLYEFSDQSLEAIKADVATWSYDKKAAVLKKCLAAPLQSNSALRKLAYSWDFTGDIATLYMLIRLRVGHDLKWQSMSPRLGYPVPATIEAAGLSDMFEACFDASLELSSLLQQAGSASVVPYVTLLGHHARWTVTLTGEDLLTLYRHMAKEPDAPQWLLHQIPERLYEVHPLFAECLGSGNDTVAANLVTDTARPFAQA